MASTYAQCGRAIRLQLWIETFTKLPLHGKMQHWKMNCGPE
jgi:hypothetical protein